MITLTCLCQNEYIHFDSRPHRKSVGPTSCSCRSCCPQFCLCGLKRSYRKSSSVGSQDRELRKVAQAVIVPLKSGLQSFNKVSEILLSVHADMVLPDTQTFHDIRRQILNMEQQLESSERKAAEELQDVDRQTEVLTADQGCLARLKQEKQLELDKLQKQLGSYRSSLETYKDALNTQRKNLESAKETLENMRKKRDEAETMRNVGLGLLVIPFIGWAVGPVVAIAGAIDMDQASDAVDTARREVDSCESQVTKYRNKVSEFQSLISKAEGEIQDVDHKIHQTDANLRDLSRRREVVADVQSKMRRVVNQLGVLSGVGNVAELQTRHLVLLEPVMKVMEEMTTALGRITGEELLNTEGIKSLLGRMKRNQEQLKCLVDAKQGEDDEYY
ncbi:uncharacterized protein [Takifugu rubripes]|uniref:uncharacterized protein n=1 Tax=Takifugu rubripes TaxID=31033 RepID=UPI001145BD88|nr:uncharacterized protein LOC115250437 [Takifugu rubripes]